MLQSGHPVFVPTLDPTTAVRLESLLDESGRPQQHDERFLRDLIHRAPNILPIAEIEPIFDNARSVCIELPNPAGFIDNLLVTPEGGVVLVECKLQRNLQARREVIAQIMDYAAQLQAWTFEDLDAAVRKAELPEGGRPAGLVELFDDSDDFDSLVFMDAITRNLRRGRMLLLVVGDGIREGLESLAGILQRHPGFHAALGLIELKLYALPAGGFIVQPRTLLRTLNVERGVVMFADDRLAVTLPTSPISASLEASRGKRPASLTEEEYYAALGSKNPAWPDMVKSLVVQLEEVGLTPEFKRSLIMRWTGADGRSHNVINFRKFGQVRVDPLSWQLRTQAEHEAATAFRQRIASACGGEVRGGQDDQNVWADGGILTVEDLRGHENECVEAVKDLVRRLHELEQAQDGRP